MIKGTEAVAMEAMVVTPADPEAKPHEVCPGVCVVASKCVGVAAATVDAVAPQETSLIRERGIKTKKKRNFKTCFFPTLNLLCSSSKKQNKQKQLPNTYDCKEQKKIIVSFFDTMIICVPTIPNPVCLLQYIS